MKRTQEKPVVEVGTTSVRKIVSKKGVALLFALLALGVLLASVANAQSNAGEEVVETPEAFITL